MAWQPKATAPDYFSLADAFLALITGDPDWGWLVDWLTLMPNQGMETAAFCAEGPVFTAPLVVTDFIPSFNPLDPRRGVQTAALLARIGAAARDRVFAAYCEIPSGTTSGWTEIARITFTVPATPTLAVDGSWNDSGGTHCRWHWHVTTPGTSYASWQSKLAGVNKYTKGGFPLSDYGPWPHDENITLSGGPFDSIALQIVGGSGASGYLAVERLDAPFGATPHTPQEQLQPDGVSSPLRTVDPSLEGIALELEKLEWKVDTLWPIVQAVAGATLDLGGPLDDAVELVPDTPLAITDAVGVVITASGIPEELDVGFGVPQEVARLGRINFGTATAWFPMIPLTHVPMIIRPLPPGTTRITVGGVPPGITMTIAPILPLK
jgi:hypothetical protein